MNVQLVTLIFAVVAGVGILLQAIVLLGMLFALRETQKKLHGVSERLEEAVFPIVYSSRRLLEDLTPKVKVISSNLVDASETLRKQAENVSSVVGDVSARTRQQTARVDSMISATLDGIGEATAAVERSIAGPLRQVNGVLAGLRAGLETLRGTKTAGKTAPSTPRPIVTADPPDWNRGEAGEAAARYVRDRAASEFR